MKTLKGIIMKANPPLLLLALFTGCFAIHAHADSESSIGGCTTSIVSTCGVQVVKTGKRGLGGLCGGCIIAGIEYNPNWYCHLRLAELERMKGKP